jgi:hypothetical protein
LQASSSGQRYRRGLVLSAGRATECSPKSPRVPFLADQPARFRLRRTTYIHQPCHPEQSRRISLRVQLSPRRIDGQRFLEMRAAFFTCHIEVRASAPSSRRALSASLGCHQPWQGRQIVAHRDTSLCCQRWEQMGATAPFRSRSPSRESSPSPVTIHESPLTASPVLALPLFLLTGVLA